VSPHAVGVRHDLQTAVLLDITRRCFGWPRPDVVAMVTPDSVRFIEAYFVGKLSEPRRSPGVANPTD
jgi:hypothetical protein